MALQCRFFPGHHRQDGWTFSWEKVKNMIIHISIKIIRIITRFIRKGEEHDHPYFQQNHQNYQNYHQIYQKRWRTRSSIFPSKSSELSPDLPEKVKNINYVILIQISSKSVATFAIIFRIISFYHQLPVWLPPPWGSLLWGFQRLFHKWIRSLSIRALSFVHFLNNVCTMMWQVTFKSLLIFARYFVQ